MVRCNLSKLVDYLCVTGYRHDWVSGQWISPTGVHYVVDQNGGFTKLFTEDRRRTDVRRTNSNRDSDSRVVDLSEYRRSGIPRN